MEEDFEPFWSARNSFTLHQVLIVELTPDHLIEIDDSCSRQPFLVGTFRLEAKHTIHSNYHTSTKKSLVLMSFNKRDYSTLRGSLDEVDFDSYTASEGDPDLLTVNKSRSLRISTIFLSTITILLLAIVATETVFLILSSQRALSKGTFVSYRNRFLNWPST